MTVSLKKFKQLIESSERILITSHISPDPDAYCSALLLGRILKLNYQEKETMVDMEEPIDSLDFLADSKIIRHEPLLKAISSFKPDLLIMLDGNNFERFSRLHGVEIRKYVELNKVKTVIVDHHEKVNADKVDLYIHRDSPATSQDIYWICSEGLKLKMPKGHEDTVMVGILGDTGRFMYQNKRHRETFEITSRMLDSGVNVEALTNKLNQYPAVSIAVISELGANLKLAKNYSYSCISDKFRDSWNIGKDQAALKFGCEIFANHFIRNIEGRKWGFVVYPDLISGAGHYGVSLRAINGTVDVSRIASRLGGGGHKPAAGASLEAKNVQAAVKLVEQAIAKTYPSKVK